MLSSPLRRARETAELLQFHKFVIDQRLIEMHWGSFEGSTLLQLRLRDPEGMKENEAKGLDFRPTNGESPREVRTRLISLIGDLANEQTLILISHKGVRRALISLLCDWNMATNPPIQIGVDDALIVERFKESSPKLSSLNLLRTSNG